MIVDLGLVDASDPQREGHIVERRQMRDETEILKHHPDPPPERWKARTRHGDDVLPEQRNEPPAWPLRQIKQAKRSEEHTSELQSLMRISYAVFCLKKKKTQTRRD